MFCILKKNYKKRLDKRKKVMLLSEYVSGGMHQKYNGHINNNSKYSKTLEEKNHPEDD